MKPWRWLLLLIAAAVLGEVTWNWLAADPGYVLIRIRGWRIEATVIGAVLILIVLWIVIALLWWLLRWPFGALSRRHKRISRKRLSDGLIALAEGRHAEAGRALERAAQHTPLRAPALLAAAIAAHRRGETPRALETLAEAGQYAPQAARMLRARILRREGRCDAALALLIPDADTGRLPPAGWHELALSALAAGQPQRARAALEPLRRGNALGARGYAALETRVLASSLASAENAQDLHALWGSLSRQQRTQPDVIAAFARRAGQYGSTLAAMDEIESALRREWSPQLVTAYGELAGDADARLVTAEGWLTAHPNDAALLLTLGRLSLRARQPQRARDYLQRAVALAPSADGWEALGEAHAMLGDANDAALCYVNALRVARGEPGSPPPQATGLDTRPVAVEERDQHGMPRLPR
ncbi:MAG: heme biosynthesis HemY N-terminal domain-containing protein [Rhodanobacteraceae bacterium]